VVARDVFLLPRMNDAQDWEVAQALHADGIPAGEYVADFDPGWFTIHYWAHVGQLKIVAEIPADNVADFWQASPLAYWFHWFSGMTYAVTVAASLATVPSEG
jgi:hypothetical protein